MEAKINAFMELVKQRNHHEPEFIQAVQEVAETVIPYIVENDIYHGKNILLRMVEPERLISFRVSWVDEGYIKPADWYMNVLLNNERFRMSVLPAEIKAEIKYKWEKHLAWLEPQDNIGRATEGYKSSIKFLDDDHTHLLNEFKQFNAEFDKLRDENFDDVYLELKNI